mgnify:CR=1 FL=1
MGRPVDVRQIEITQDNYLVECRSVAIKQQLFKFSHGL